MYGKFHHQWVYRGSVKTGHPLYLSMQPPDYEGTSLIYCLCVETCPPIRPHKEEQQCSASIWEYVGDQGLC